MQLLETRLVPARPATARAEPADPPPEEALPLDDPTATATAVAVGGGVAAAGATAAPAAVPLPLLLGPVGPARPPPDVAVTAVGGTATAGWTDDGALLLELMVAAPHHAHAGVHARAAVAAKRAQPVWPPTKAAGTAHSHGSGVGPTTTRLENGGE